MALSDEQIERYSRHIILKEVGAKGQKKLLNAKVLIIGAGGLGAPAAMYLAAAGVGTIGIADADEVDLSNLQRQIIHQTADVGKAKVQSAKETINAMNPDVTVNTYREFITSENIMDIIKDYDFIIDGTDNFPAKFLINDACVLEKKPFSHAGIIRFKGQLGSGFKIAMRDLELRGAGNLLGAQQHGHMNAVGYDLYCKMLNEAVKEAKGIHTMEDFETSVDLNVDAYIPDSYISSEFQKLDIYKRIAGIETQQDYDDMLEELLDRFGEPGKAVLNLLAIAKLKAIAHQGYVTEIKQTGKTVRFTLYEKARLNTEGFPALMQKYRRGLQFKNEQEPKFILEPQGNLILTLTEFAEELKSMAENM